MVYEHVVIKVQSGRSELFEQALATARQEAFGPAQGFVSLDARRCIEDPNTYVCIIGWQRLEDHTVTFRASPLFMKWRGLVGEYFAEPPGVLHFAEVPLG